MAEIRDLPPTVPKTIKMQVDSILDGLDRDNRIAVVAVTDLSGVRLAGFYKMYEDDKSSFSFMGYIDKPYKGDLEAGAKLMWSHK
jgi:hypothetical protein